MLSFSNTANHSEDPIEIDWDTTIDIENDKSYCFVNVASGFVFIASERHTGKPLSALRLDMIPGSTEPFEPAIGMNNPVFKKCRQTFDALFDYACCDDDCNRIRTPNDLIITIFGGQPSSQFMMQGLRAFANTLAVDFQGLEVKFHPTFGVMTDDETQDITLSSDHSISVSTSSPMDVHNHTYTPYYGAPTPIAGSSSNTSAPLANAKRNKKKIEKSTNH